MIHSTKEMRKEKSNTPSKEDPIRAQITDSIETSVQTSGFIRYQAEEAKNNLSKAEELKESIPNKKLNQRQEKEINIQKEVAKKVNWLAPIEYSVISG